MRSYCVALGSRMERSPEFFCSDQSEGEGEAAGAEQLVVDDAKPEPTRKFAVLLHNDDFTTMEFVVEILRKRFHKTEEEAAAIMLRVHTSGKAVAGIYSFEIAETKVEQVHQEARARGFPLLCTLEAL